MTEAHLLGQAHVFGYGQDAARGNDPTAADDHGAIVQGAVLEEDVFDEACIDVGHEHFARLGVVRKIHLAADDDQGAGLLAGHVHTGQDNGGDVVLLLGVRCATREEFGYEAPTGVRPKGDEEAADVVLKEYHKHNETDADETIEDGAHEAHLKHLRDDQPNDDHGDNAAEDGQCAGAFHQLIDLVGKEGYQQDVERVFDAEGYHYRGVF